MRLLNVQTLTLEEYFGASIPRYAILSHCWGAEEVTFRDVNDVPWQTSNCEKLGARKITLSSTQAKNDGLNYIWIDTCCIDKTSSAELSEAINSMYSWYENATVCYAFLEDMDHMESSSKATERDRKFEQSRWFTRGWTLQELIAPADVQFYDRYWNFQGDKTELCNLLSKITKISEGVLMDPSRRHASSVARKMSWAAGRQTTRIEDIAYSLLGIFNVNMPLLYGEGEKAFIRLQEEILKETDDQSLLAWGISTGKTLNVKSSTFSGALARSPSDFSQSANVVSYPSPFGSQPYSMTNKGLRIELPLWSYSQAGPRRKIAMLNCHFENDFSGSLGVCLISPFGTETNTFTRDWESHGGVRKFSPKDSESAENKVIFIAKNPPRVNPGETLVVRCDSAEALGYSIVKTLPSFLPWNKESKTLQLRPPRLYNSTLDERTIDYLLPPPRVALVFWNATNGSGFVVKPNCKDIRAESYSQVQIANKPASVPLDRWLKMCEDVTSISGSRDHLKINLSPGVTIGIRANRSSTNLLNQELQLLDLYIESSRTMDRYGQPM